MWLLYTTFRHVDSATPVLWQMSLFVHEKNHFVVLCIEFPLISKILCTAMQWELVVAEVGYLLLKDMPKPKTCCRYGKLVLATRSKKNLEKKHFTYFPCLTCCRACVLPKVWFVEKIRTFWMCNARIKNYPLCEILKAQFTLVKIVIDTHTQVLFVHWQITVIWSCQQVYGFHHWQGAAWGIKGGIFSNFWKHV